jgi:hypothetical protein
LEELDPYDPVPVPKGVAAAAAAKAATRSDVECILIVWILVGLKRLVGLEVSW